MGVEDAVIIIIDGAGVDFDELQVTALANGGEQERVRLRQRRGFFQSFLVDDPENEHRRENEHLRPDPVDERAAKRRWLYQR